MLHRTCKGDTFKMRQVICFRCLSLRCDNKICTSPITLEKPKLCSVCGDIAFMTYDISEKGAVDE